MEEQETEGILEVQTNESFGRFVTATRDIEQGELILYEKPLLYGPSWNSDICCLNCYQKPMKICKVCWVAPLCGKCDEHGQAECQFYKARNIDKSFTINNFNVVTPIRFLSILLAGVNEDCSENELLQMESHEVARKESPIWLYSEKFIIEPIINEVKDTGITAKLLQTVCGILDVNTFELRNVNQFSQPCTVLLRGLFPRAALLAHDCCANAFISLDNANHIRVYANRAIKRNEMITYNYTKTLYGTDERQKHLMEGKYFKCSCKRCEDPTEMGTNLSSIACMECIVGLCTVSDGQWICGACLEEHDDELVQKIIRKAWDDINEGETVEVLDTLITKFTKLLNKSHWLVVEAKQKFVSLLRDRGNIKPELLVKKLNYCEEIIAIIRVFEPNISRLNGIALYENYKTLHELSQNRFEAGEMLEDDFMEKLKACEALLKESIEHLTYEPPKTPESQLMRFALQELRWLRESVK